MPKSITDTMAAAEALAMIWTNDPDLAAEVARKLNCEEIAPLLTLFKAIERPDAAELWLRCHAVGDDDEEADDWEHIALGRLINATGGL